MVRTWGWAGLLAGAAWLAGCAATPQAHVALDPQKLASNTERIGVAMTPIPKADTSFPGAGCLLCMAAAAVANASLTSFTQTLPPEDLPALKVSIAQALAKKGADATVIDEPLKLDALPAGKAGAGFSTTDFSSLKAKYHIDKLIVIDIQALGVQRSYSAYVPTGDPRSMLRGVGYMVNLSSNAYEWYLPVNVQRGADGPWDEPPKFPGVSNAYFQVLELGKDAFLEPFLQ